MAETKFGLSYTDLEDIIGPVEVAERAEAWGYDSFWVPDYILKSSIDPLALMAAASNSALALH